MANFTARHDPATGYVYLTSSDEYPIPDDVWDWLKAPPYSANYSHEHRGELRLTRDAAREAVRSLEASGHRVTAITGTRAESPRRGRGSRGPLECETCGQPYRVGTVVAPGQMCTNGASFHYDPESGRRVHDYEPHPLGELVPPPS